MVVLKVDGRDNEWNVNRKQKGFVWMSHSGFVVSDSVDNLLLEVFQLKEHGFGFIGDR